VLEQGVVKVLTTEVGVTGGGLDGEHLAGDGEKGDIESTTTEVKDEDVALLLGLLVKTVGNGGGGRLVDDTENLETSNGTGVLGGETLRVVEVGGDAGLVSAARRWIILKRIASRRIMLPTRSHSRNHGLLDGLAKLGLRDLLHLGEDHGGDLLGREGLVLAEVLDLNERRAILVDDGERPVLRVLLDIGVVKAATDQSLGVEHGVLRVHGGLVLGGCPGQRMVLCEGLCNSPSPIRRSPSVKAT
jgi:hypothetical protein